MSATTLVKCPRCEKHGTPLDGKVMLHNGVMKKLKSCEYCGWKLKGVSA